MGPETGAQQWPAAGVFDFDGLLLETHSAWRTAYEAALRSEGRTIDPQGLASLAGVSVGMAARRLGVSADRLRVELEIAMTSAEQAPLPGARALLDLLQPRLRLAVATNGPAALVTEALRRAGLLDYFDDVISAEEQPREKPAPDVYRAACAALGVDPSDAIAFEDSPVGVASARRAGLIVVYVPSDSSRSTEADLVVNRLDDPALLSLLGRADGYAVHPDARIEARQELARVCESVLGDELVARAGPDEIHQLAGSLKRSLIFWRRGRLTLAGRSPVLADPDDEA